MSFCVNCGHRLSEKDSFCAYCGSPKAVIPTRQYNYESKKENIKERTVFRCPGCGAVVNSFSANCPFCGSEFRDISPSAAVKELDARLQAVNTYESKAFKEEKNQQKLIV